MSEGVKVAVGIVVAALLLAVVYVAYREFDRARDLRQAQEVMGQILRVPAQMDVELAEADQKAAQRRREEVAVSWNRRLLTGNQRCVGGVVVLVDGASYSQLGTVGDPVRCSGRYADRPIR
ncbi:MULTISPECIES: hypothetical protein [Rhodanobacter]|uniref:hypothetical protein n=1 Tax=Rhodanobacter TaxID=75309 RepID=UPI000484514E|nr:MULTISPECIES: hypothetical protein [Rhodanobacter]TAN15914.1 MAG: hypothetical protein EPN35_11885 [Rhodanobacter sp.]UJJ53516.1 hypothetical protein LRK53_11015 [Rhodanobacter thiooxydans]